MSQDLATEVLSASLPNSLSARSVHLQLRIISDSQILSWLKKKKNKYNSVSLENKPGLGEAC